MKMEGCARPPLSSVTHTALIAIAPTSNSIHTDRKKTMMNLPSLRHLWHLTALHDHGHFGRAAEACHVTQSTLSASIKELESVLEATLVDRSKRRVVFTPVGIETVERARRIVKDIEDLVSFTASAREPLSGALRMGAIPTVGPFLLPRVLPGLRDSY